MAYTDFESESDVRLHIDWQNPTLYHSRAENDPSTSSCSVMRSKLLQQAAAEEERPPVDFTHLHLLGQYPPAVDQLVTEDVLHNHSDSQLTNNSKTIVRDHFNDKSLPSTTLWNDLRVHVYV